MTGIENLKIEKFEGKDMGQRVESNQLESFFGDKFFEDLENSDVKIFHKGNSYVFEQKDINGNDLSENGDKISKFYVEKKEFRQYLRKLEELEQENTKRHKLLEEFLVTIGGKQELDTLSGEVNSNTTENLNESPEKLISEIDNLINWFQENRRRPRAPKVDDNRYSKVRFQQVIKDDLASLRSIKRELKNYNYTTNIDYFADYVENMKSHKEQLEKVRQIITTGGNTAEIPAMLDSINDVRKEELFQRIAANYNLEYNKVMQIATMMKLKNKDMEAYQEYLQKVRSGEIEHPSQDEFCVKYMDDFEKLAQTNPGLYGEVFSKRDLKNENYTGAGKTNYTRYNTGGTRPKGSKESGNMFSDMLVKMGIIDENDKKKQAAWAKFGKVGILALGAFAIYKIFTTKGKGRRGWIGGLLGGVVAYNNADKIKDRFGDAFGKSNPTPEETAENFNVSPDDANQYIIPKATTLRCLGGIPIQTLVSGGIMEEVGGKMRINYDKYETYINATNMDQGEKDMNLEAMKDIKNDNSQNIVHQSLVDMGIDNLNELENLADDDKTTLLDTNNVGNYFESLSSPVNAKLEQHGFEPKDAESWYEITKEYNAGNFNDYKIIEWAKKGLIKLNEKKPYTLNEMMNNNEIDLQEKKIKELNIKFSTYEELFDATQLTKVILETFKGKPSANGDETPFHEGALGNIEFNNSNRWEAWNLRGDTDAVSSNFYKNTLKDVSESLFNKKDEYIKYLNKKRAEEI